MLVLSRKVGERILIGDEVVVTVLGVSAHQVRLGIEAPRSIDVLRAELAVGRAGEKPGPGPQRRPVWATP
jgi:carbon storage regulator